MIREDGKSTITTDPFMNGTLTECSDSSVRVYVENKLVHLCVGAGKIGVSFPIHLLGSIRDVLGHAMVAQSQAELPSA